MDTDYFLLSSHVYETPLLFVLETFCFLPFCFFYSPKKEQCTQFSLGLLLLAVYTISCCFFFTFFLLSALCTWYLLGPVWAVYTSVDKISTNVSGLYISFVLHLAILECRWSELAAAHSCLFQIFWETEIFALISVRKLFRTVLISKPGVNYYRA